jgi:N-formylglutamate amidohydrolase
VSRSENDWHIQQLIQALLKSTAAILVAAATRIAAGLTAVRD